MKPVLNKTSLVWGLLLLFGIGSCRKESYDIQTVSENYQLQKVWEYKLKMPYGIQFVQNSDGDVLTLPNISEELTLLDGKTGDVKWTWNDWERLLLQQPLVIWNNILMITDYNVVCAVDALRGQTLWKFAPDTLSSIVDDLYSIPVHLSEKGNFYRPYFLSGSSDKLYFYKTQCTQSTWERVFYWSDSSVTQTKLSVVDIVTARKKNGDEVIVVAVNDQSKGYFRLVCYNETKKQFDWVLNPPYINGFRDARIFIKDDKLVLLSREDISRGDIYGLDLDNGNIIWRTMRLDVICSNAVLYKDLLVFQSGSSGLEAIDIQSGARGWSSYLVDGKNTVFNISERSFSTHQNTLLVTTGSNLFGFDMASGKKILVKDVRYNTVLNAEVNPQNQLLYLQNGTALTCFELPESLR